MKIVRKILSTGIFLVGMSGAAQAQVQSFSTSPKGSVWNTMGFGGGTEPVRVTGIYCHGDTPTLADVCLYAQICNNRRFGISLDPWPTIARIFDSLEKLPAFTEAAQPEQPDAA
jgi:hypothetical protein